MKMDYTSIPELKALNNLSTEELRHLLEMSFEMPDEMTREELIDLYIRSQYDSEDPEDPDTNKSLYERLGGIYAIAAVVDRFSDALIRNPIVGRESKNSFLRDWSTNQLDRLPGLKWMRTLWVADISGGPYEFVATEPGACPMSLENAHRKFEISPEESDAVAKELLNALDYYSVPEKEKQEVLNAFAGHKDEVNTGFFEAKHIRIPPIHCPMKNRNSR